MSNTDPAYNSLFISDLHLCEERPQTLALFQQFLNTTARQCQRLYILGDLFEYWVGDDMASTLHRQVAAWIRDLVDHGVAVHFMHGNRDFLLGKRFSQLCGWTLLDDPHTLIWQGETLLLTHGDLLCIDDVDYIKFRRFSRNRFRISVFLHLPKAFRRWIARRMRRASMNKNTEIMDVNQEEVVRVFIQYQARWMIHGHTHRPASHEETVADKTVTRHVLADWDDCGEVLALGPAGFERIALPTLHKKAPTQRGRETI